MSRIGFCSTCFAVILLAVSCQETRAQGLLLIEPQPFDGVLSPNPLGPPQKFDGLPPGSPSRFSRLQQSPASRARQADAARDGEAKTQRRPSQAAGPRPAASRSFARGHEVPGGTVGSVLSLAPRYGERSPAHPFCFPPSTLHVQQDARCNVAAAARGRFEELLGE
jgi:hypothetical protein